MNITGGIYNGQKIMAPDERLTRPTLSKVRMGVFNTLNSMIDFKGKSFLDMFSGSGIMCLEAISRGFEKAVSVEKNKKVYNILKSNFSKYDKSHDIKLYLGDSLKLVTTFQEKFDIIYIDPPYFSGVYEQCLESIKLVSKGFVILEHVTEIKIPQEYEVLKQKKYGDKYITFLKYNS